jgi:lauroyl/myristoyl acyltransferase
LGIGLVAWVFYFGLGWLPNKVRYWVLLPLAWGVFQLLPGKKKQIKNNLRLIRPDWDQGQVSKGAWENVKTLLRSWSAILSVEKESLELVRKRVVGEESLLESCEQGRKVVVVFPHVGPVNELVSLVAALGIEAYVPAEAIPPMLFRLMAGSRARHGSIEFEPVRKGKTMERCQIKLEEGKVVVLAVDMPPSRKQQGYSLHVGCAETSVQVGGVKLAFEEGADLFLAFPYWREEDPEVLIEKFEFSSTDVSLETHRLLENYEEFLLPYVTNWWRLSLIEMKPSSNPPEEDGFNRRRLRTVGRKYVSN